MNLVDRLEQEVRLQTAEWLFTHPARLSVSPPDVLVRDNYTFVIKFLPSSNPKDPPPPTSLYASIQQSVLEADPLGAVQAVLDDLKNELVKKGLFQSMSRYRVLERVSSGQGNNWSTVSEGTLWQGDDPRQYTGKYGQIGSAFLRKTENVLQIRMEGDNGSIRWDDVDPARAISRFKPRPQGGFNSPRKQYEAQPKVPRYQHTYYEAGQYMPELVEALTGKGKVALQEFPAEDHTTRRAEERRLEAQRHLAQKRAMQAKQLTGDVNAAAAHMAKTRGDDTKANQFEADRVALGMGKSYANRDPILAWEREAAARDQEEKRKASIRKMAAASFNGVQGLVENARIAWRESALQEAEARDEQVEDELFGGGGEGIQREIIWSGAERAAQKLLEFAQARVEEARARAAGTSLTDIEFVEEEDDATLAAFAKNEGQQEHVSESEYVKVEIEQEKKVLGAALIQGAPDIDEMDLLDDTVIDELVSLTTKTG